VPKQCTVKIECVLNEEGHSSIYEVLPTLTVGKVKENFNFKHVNFRCVESETGSNINQAIDVFTLAAEAATTKTIDAFRILMAGRREHVKRKTSR